MNQNFSIDVIIPVYNEGQNIEKNLNFLETGINQTKIFFNIYIVYDFLEDNTLPVIEKIKSKYSFPIKLVKNNHKGVINAIKEGFQVSNGNYILVTMADMSDDYSILPRMAELAQQGNDIVCGSRYMKGGKLNGGPFFKQLLSRLAGLSIYFLTKIPTHDITNSYKLYNRKILKGLNLESQGGFEIGMEITAKAYLMGYKIVEIPSQWWDRTQGISKFKLWKWILRYLKWYIYILFHSKKKLNA